MHYKVPIIEHLHDCFASMQTLGILGLIAQVIVAITVAICVKAALARRAALDNRSPEIRVTRQLYSKQNAPATDRSSFGMVICELQSSAAFLRQD